MRTRRPTTGTGTRTETKATRAEAFRSLREVVGRGFAFAAPGTDARGPGGNDARDRVRRGASEGCVVPDDAPGMGGVGRAVRGARVRQSGVGGPGGVAPGAAAGFVDRADAGLRVQCHVFAARHDERGPARRTGVALSGGHAHTSAVLCGPGGGGPDRGGG